MLPLYVILELNHKTLPSNNTSPDSTQKQMETVSNQVTNIFNKYQKVDTNL